MNPNKTPQTGLMKANQVEKSHLCFTIVFNDFISCYFMDSLISYASLGLVRWIDIAAEEADNERAGRKIGSKSWLNVPYPQNDLPAAMTALTQFMGAARFRKRKDAVEHDLEIARVDQGGNFG